MQVVNGKYDVNDASTRLGKAGIGVGAAAVQKFASLSVDLARAGRARGSSSYFRCIPLLGCEIPLRGRRARHYRRRSSQPHCHRPGSMQTRAPAFAGVTNCWSAENKAACPKASRPQRKGEFTPAAGATSARTTSPVPGAASTRAGCIEAATNEQTFPTDPGSAQVCPRGGNPIACMLYGAIANSPGIAPLRRLGGEGDPTRCWPKPAGLTRGAGEGEVARRKLHQPPPSPFSPPGPAGEGFKSWLSEVNFAAG
jgi:hypothetical protein